MQPATTTYRVLCEYCQAAWDSAVYASPVRRRDQHVRTVHGIAVREIPQLRQARTR